MFEDIKLKKEYKDLYEIYKSAPLKKLWEYSEELQRDIHSYIKEDNYLLFNRVIESLVISELIREKSFEDKIEFLYGLIQNKKSCLFSLDWTSEKEKKKMKEIYKDIENQILFFRREYLYF